MIKNPLRKILYWTHIWGGLVITAFLTFYLLSGYFVNHRGYYGNMETRIRTDYQFTPEQAEVTKRFMETMKKFGAAMAPYTKRADWENIYVDSDGTANILYRSQGYSFAVQPDGRTGTYIRTFVKQPWSFLTSQIHTTRGMMHAWVWMSTILAFLVFSVLLSGLLIVRWRRLELILFLAGVALILICMVLCQQHYFLPEIGSTVSPTSYAG